MQEGDIAVGESGEVLRYQFGFVTVLGGRWVFAIDAAKLDVRSLLLVTFGADHFGSRVSGVEVFEEKMVDVVRCNKVGNLTHGIDLGFGLLVERCARHDPELAIAHLDGDTASANGEDAKTAKGVVKGGDLGRHLLNVDGCLGLSARRA